NELLKTIKTQLAKKEQLKEEMEQGSELKPQGAVPGTQRALNRETFLFLADSRSASFVKIAEIKCIISDKDYSKIFIKDNKRFILKKSLRSWLGVLPKSIFLRINKSTIINLNFVLRVEEWFNGSYMVYLDGASEPFNISTRTVIKLRKDIFVRKV
ncbi:MAG: LytTR family transcriptional regulator, partial [Chlorobiota bacterium]